MSGRPGPAETSPPAGLPLGDLAIGGGVILIVVVGAIKRLGLRFAGRHRDDLLLALVAGLVLLAAAAGSLVLLRRRRSEGVGGRGVGTRGARTARTARTRGGGAGPMTEGWATKRDLTPLLVGEVPGDRVVLGRMKRSLVAAEPLQSVLVVGPSQSGKTSSLAIPAVLDWAGPVLATSVKTDLVRDTIEARTARGEVAVFDPTGVTGLPSVGWSPLAGASTWAGARRVADSLCSVGRRDGGIEDSAYWYAAAERLLGPLLRAAALASGSMSDVVRWLDDQTVNEPLLALEIASEHEAGRAARSCFAMEERQRSSVYSTAQTVVAAYSDPEVALSERFSRRLTATWLLESERPGQSLSPGENPSRTLYCCAPARDQSRLSPIFVALVRSVLDAAFEQASRLGRPSSPPLLVVLDEAANIAPLSDLDQLLATAAGHGVSFVTVWQDLAQIEARYGARWATIVNNHRAKVVCPGVADPRTLELLSSLIGEVETAQRSRSRTGDGSWSETESSWRVPVAPAGWIRRLPAHHSLTVYGGLPPALVQMRPWFESSTKVLDRMGQSVSYAPMSYARRRPLRGTLTGDADD